MLAPEFMIVCELKGVLQIRLYQGCIGCNMLTGYVSESKVNKNHHIEGFLYDDQIACDT